MQTLSVKFSQNPSTTSGMKNEGRLWTPRHVELRLPGDGSCYIFRSNNPRDRAMTNGVGVIIEQWLQTCGFTTPSSTKQNSWNSPEEGLKRFYSVSFPSICKVPTAAQNEFPHPLSAHTPQPVEPNVETETDAHLITEENAYKSNQGNKFHHLFGSFHIYGRQIISLTTS
jgi:hypothetical protein